jgi:protein TonB
MKAVINQTGDVESVELLSGHPMLVQAALDAVKQWKYRPYLLNGNAVAVETQVTVNFTLSEQ